MVADGCTLSIGIHGVQQTDGNSCVFSRLYTGGVKDLGTEIGKLSSLLEMQLMDRGGLVNHTRVIVMHAVDVCPYLNLLSIQRGTDQRGGIVAATTLQVVHLTIGVTADEALGDIYLLSLVLLHDGGELLTDIDGVWLRVLVGTHEIEGVEQYSLDALFLHVVDHHIGRHHLTLCHDILLLERGEELLGKRAQIVHLCHDEVTGHCLHLLSGVQFLDMLHVLTL